MKIIQRSKQRAKIMIVEDELMCSKYINSIITAENFENIGTAQTLRDAEVLFDLHKPDLIISDICLKDNTIFDIIFQDKYLKIPILFITGVLENENISKCSQHKKSILLSKPLHKYSLLSSIQLLLNVFPPEHQHYIEVIHRNNQVIKVKLSEILFVEAEGNYTSIHTINNKVYTRKITLKTVQNELSNTFVQINKSHIVNTSFIKRLELGKGQLLLTNQKMFKIGRVYRKQLDQFILKN